MMDVSHGYVEACSDNIPLKRLTLIFQVFVNFNNILINSSSKHLKQVLHFLSLKGTATGLCMALCKLGWHSS